jgi:hypothetical protein
MEEQRRRIEGKNTWKRKGERERERVCECLQYGV